MSTPDPAGTAALYRSTLPPGPLVEVDVTGDDRTGVPTLATVWRDARDAGTDGHGVGYGDTADAAAVGALGELAEHVLPLGRGARGHAAAPGPPVVATTAELLARRGPRGVADPLALVLPAGADADRDRPLLWLPAVRWRTGEEVLVPAELAAPSAAAIGARPPSGAWLTTPVTNGMGAGDSVERALGHALLELVQRDGNTVDLRALDPGAVVDETGITDPVTRSWLERIRGAGVDVAVKLASTELACVVHVVGADDDPATSPLAVTAIGEAAHPDREVAVRKAVLEFGASRARRAFAFGPLEDLRARHPSYLAAELAVPVGPQEPRALREMARWTRMSAAELSALLAPTVLARRSTVPFGQLPSAPRASWATPAALLGTLLDRLAAFDVLALRWSATAPDGREAHVVRAVVPGLEVETLSYLRIGERVLTRLLERGSDLVGRGEPTGPDQLPVRLTAEAAERVGGPAWLDRAAVARTVGELYPLYREPSRHAPQRLAAGL